MQLISYLNFQGNCREAFALYEQVLGGEIVVVHTYADMSDAGDAIPGWGYKIMHIRLVVGDAVLMGSDVPPEHNFTPAGFEVAIMLTETAEAERIYEALSEGGDVRMPTQETFWAHRFAMFTDRFGIPWMINVEKPM